MRNMKAGILILMVTLLSGCSWPRVKIAGDDYLLSPLAPGRTITVPTSTGGSGSAAAGRGVQPPMDVPK